MRISVWSSDVCSSDLLSLHPFPPIPSDENRNSHADRHCWSEAEVAADIFDVGGGLISPTAKSVRLFAIRSPDYNAVYYAIRIWIRWATGDKDFPMIKRWLLSFAAAQRWPVEGDRKSTRLNSSR